MKLLDILNEQEISDKLKKKISNYYLLLKKGSIEPHEGSAFKIYYILPDDYEYMYRTATPQGELPVIRVRYKDVKYYLIRKEGGIPHELKNQVTSEELLEYFTQIRMRFRKFNIILRP
jgi:hypothetical protein